MNPTQTVPPVRTAGKPAPRASAIAVLLLTAACSAAPQSHGDPTAAVDATPVSPSPSAGAAPSPGASSAGGDASTADPRSACQVLAANLAFLQQATTAAGGPELSAAIARMRQLAQSAPVDIRSDVTVIADFDQKVLDTTSAGGSPDGIGETPELTAALQHEAAWVSRNCR